MTLRLIAICLLLGRFALAQGTSPGIDYGNRALADGLWEVAELHFRQALADPTLPASGKSEATIGLAEALIRSGNFTEALELTNRSNVAKLPEAAFWRAHALAGTGKLNDAADAFAALMAEPGFAHAGDAGLNRAGLLLALGRQDDALQTLTGLLANASPQSATRIRLYQVEILLDMNRPADARRVLPTSGITGAGETSRAAFLEARLLLEEGNAVEAEKHFREQLSHPEGQSEAMFHGVAAGLADAIHAQGRPADAIQSLLDYIEAHPDSKLLDPLFDRIVAWLPKNPVPSDPVLERVNGWIPPAALPVASQIGSEGTVFPPSPAAPANPDMTDLQAHALFVKAILLRRFSNDESKRDARILMDRLRWEMPDDPLANRALFRLGKWALEDGAVDRAISILDSVKDGGGENGLRGSASYLEARAAYDRGDTSSAAALFDEAAKLLDSDRSQSAQWNAAVIRLRAGSEGGSTLIRQDGAPTPPAALGPDVELERALTTKSPAEARKANEAFLTKYPEHPRAWEARLAAAEAALLTTPADLSFAKAQLDTIDAAATKPANFPVARMELDRVRIADVSRDAAAVAAGAQKIDEAFPKSPEAAEAALLYGRNLFQTGSYNAARLILEKLAASDTDTKRAQAAWLLAARSAALGGTPKSQEASLILFDKAIELKGPLAAMAALEKGRLLIDMTRLADAATFLRKWISGLPEGDPLRTPAGFLLGEALYAQGSTQASSLPEALAVYDNLMATAQPDQALMNRLQYLRGKTFELMPDEKDPSKKREKQAFQAYHSVLETETAPAEWEYFERCGFRAVELLEKAGRWQAAISVSRKLASFQGPHAAAATAKANELQLKHMIWED